MSIEESCKLWSDGHLTSLWQYASDHARKSNSKPPKEQTNEYNRKVRSAIFKVKEELLGKACKALTSYGIAPNTPATWSMLEQKHPKGTIPPCPEVTLPSEGFTLPSDFDIISVLRHFPRDTACGPPGLRIQHLIEATEVHLPISTGSSLRAVVNILVHVGGRAPSDVAKFLAGGSLTA